MKVGNLVVNCEEGFNLGNLPMVSLSNKKPSECMLIYRNMGFLSYKEDGFLTIFLSCRSRSYQTTLILRKKSRWPFGMVLLLGTRLLTY